MNVADRLLKTGEVAGLFRVDSKTVRRWAKAGKIGRVGTPTGQGRYRESEVLALLELRGLPAGTQQPPRSTLG